MDAAEGIPSITLYANKNFTHHLINELLALAQINKLPEEEVERVKQIRDSICRWRELHPELCESTSLVRDAKY